MTVSEQTPLAILRRIAARKQPATLDDRTPPTCVRPGLSARPRERRNSRSAGIADRRFEERTRSLCPQQEV